MYSELYTKSRLRPLKILSGVAVFVLVAAGIFLFTQDATPTRASKRTLLEHEIVNVSPQQIGVLWQTDEADVGWIIYGTSPNALSNIARDERDISGEQRVYTYHYAVMRDIEPDTMYYYKIVSDNELISQDGQAFEAQSLPTNAPISNTSPIYGKVLLPNGQPARNTFALVLIEPAFPLLAQTGSTGEWLVPVQYMAHKDTRAHVPITEDSIITIQFFDESARSLVRSTLSRSKPLPQSITLGNNYSFIADSTVLSAQTTRVPEQKEIANSVEIRFPKQNAVIPGTAPLIKGTGIPGKQVTVTIDAKPLISAVVAVDDQGVWSMPMTGSLKPGKYKLTVKTQDGRNSSVTLTRDFTMIKSGERVLGEETTASPSGTLTPSTNITPTIVVTTSTPTPIASPTIAITAGPTVTPMTVTATPTPPVSGTNVLPYITAGIGMFLLGVGVVLLL